MIIHKKRSINFQRFIRMSDELPSTYFRDGYEDVQETVDSQLRIYEV